MNTTEQSREPRTQRVRRLALPLALGAAVLATIGNPTSTARAFEPNADVAGDQTDIVRKLPGRTNYADLAFEPNGAAAALPPDPGSPTADIIIY